MGWAATVAQSLGLREGGSLRAEELVARALAGRDLLLVLDNFEHVLGAAPWVAELLDAAPRLTVVATSRKPLERASRSRTRALYRRSRRRRG